MTERVSEKRSVQTTLEDQAMSAGGNGGGRSLLWAHGRGWFVRIAALEPGSRGRNNWKQRARKAELDEADTFGALALALEIRRERDIGRAGALRVCSAALLYVRDVVLGLDATASESRLRLSAIAWIQQDLNEAGHG